MWATSQPVPIVCHPFPSTDKGETPMVRFRPELKAPFNCQYWAEGPDATRCGRCRLLQIVAERALSAGEQGSEYSSDYFRAADDAQRFSGLIHAQRQKFQTELRAAKVKKWPILGWRISSPNGIH